MSHDKSTDSYVWGDQKIRRCSICEGEFIGKGNNARPVNDGRCCDECNSTVVVPVRMRELLSRVRLDLN